MVPCPEQRFGHSPRFYSALSGVNLQALGERTVQSHRLPLILLDGPFVIVKLPPGTAMPSWAISGQFCSITRTADELSIVCAEFQVPPGVQAERGWRCLRVAGKMDFSMVGVLASLVGPLAEAGISVFAISTFDTDYLLVKDAAWERAKESLVGAGHLVR